MASPGISRSRSAALINEHATVTLMTDDELEEMGATIWRGGFPFHLDNVSFQSDKCLKTGSAAQLRVIFVYEP